MRKIIICSDDNSDNDDEDGDDNNHYDDWQLFTKCSVFKMYVTYVWSAVISRSSSKDDRWHKFVCW